MLTKAKRVVAAVGVAALAAIGITAATTSSDPPTGSLYFPMTTTRILSSHVASNSSDTVTVTGSNGVPAGATAAAVNLTASGSTASGFLTIYQGGTARPVASNLHYGSGATVSNFAIVPLSSSGALTVYDSNGNPVVNIDLEGYYSGGSLVGPPPSPTPTTTSPSPTPTTSSPSPTPTTTSPSPTPTVTAAACAGAPAGYTNVFCDTFTKAAPLGTFGTTNGDAVVYTGDHGGQWTSYPDGWGSTNSSCGYNPATVASVDSHGLDFALHTNSSSASSCPGNPVGANLHPDVYPTAATNPGYFTYGRVSVTMQLSGYSNAYHIVPLLWPINDSDWQSAESDFPEFDASSGASVDAFAHYGGAGAQDDFTVPSTVNGKPFSVLASHTYVQQWTPSGTSYYVDGQLIGTSTHRTWANPERVQLQMEPSGSSGVDTHVYVTNFEIDQFNGSTPSPTPTTTSPSPTPTTTSPSPTPTTTSPSPTPTTTSPSPTPTGTAGAAPAHTVVVMEENHDRSQVVGSGSAPYIDSLAAQGVDYTNDTGLDHPSLPNYLALYSGSEQGQSGNDTCIQSSASNLGSQGAGVAEYAQGIGSDPTVDNGAYACRHNPLAQFTDSASANGSHDFSAFPTTAAGFAALPKLTFVTPDLNNDAHDGSVSQADSWLSTNLGAYQTWAQTHHSVLIVWWDENAGNGLTTPVALDITGQGVVHSSQSGHVTHLNVFDTLRNWYVTPTSGSLPGLPSSF